MIYELALNVDIIAKAMENENGLIKGRTYEVSRIEMGQSRTSVYLKDYVQSFNSILFEFYHNDRKIDIYRSPLFNPYMRKPKALPSFIHYVTEEDVENEKTSTLPF